MYFPSAAMPYLLRLFPRFSHMLVVKSIDLQLPGLSFQVLKVCIDKNTVISRNLS